MATSTSVWPTGFAGPLALLALAHRSGHRVPGMPDALRRMADWVLSVGYTDDDRGMQWPGRIAYPEEARRSSRPSRLLQAPRKAGARSRPGWCYGTAGIAWTLHLAGQALGDRRLTAVAEEAVSGLARRPHDAAGVRRPGPLPRPGGHPAHRQSAWPTATGRTDVVGRRRTHLARELVAECDARTPFGYRQVLAALPTPAPAPAPSPPPAPRRMHNPGLLEGAAGIALVLADYADARRGSPHSPSVNGWDAALLMG